MLLRVSSLTTRRSIVAHDKKSIACRNIQWGPFYGPSKWAIKQGTLLIATDIGFNTHPNGLHLDGENLSAIGQIVKDDDWSFCHPSRMKKCKLISKQMSFPIYGKHIKTEIDSFISSLISPTSNLPSCRWDQLNHYPWWGRCRWPTIHPSCS